MMLRPNGIVRTVVHGALLGALASVHAGCGDESGNGEQDSFGGSPGAVPSASAPEPLAVGPGVPGGVAPGVFSPVGVPGQGAVPGEMATPGQVVLPGEDGPAMGVQPGASELPPLDTPPGAVPPVADAPAEPLEIGQGVVRRLTRTEYNYTVRDLLGLDTAPADSFPGDIGADGFDKASGPQTVSASHLSAYARAAEEVVEAAFADPAARARLVSCELGAQDCLRSSLEAAATSAWRRPVTADELGRLLQLADSEAAAGGNEEEQLKLALRGVYLSPHFLYLIERDPVPDSGEIHPLSGFELASRLSYFLWSSTPDSELLGAAANLQDEAALQQQIQRMLSDPRAVSLAEVFATQWLQLNRLASHQPNAEEFPAVTEQLRASMAAETRSFFDHLLRNQGQIDELLTADYTFVEAELAEFYGLPTPDADGRVSLAGSERLSGVLGHAGILMHTSGLLATSAVKRGEWVLENILCAPAPPPPPDVMEEILEQQAALEELAAEATEREFLSKHREDPKCAVCHSLIDPIGLSLENYDAVGLFRELDQGKPIDPSGTLVDGTSFADARELARILSEDPRLRSCVTQKLFTFALGRAPSPADRAQLQGAVVDNQEPLSSALTRLVQSAPFRYRRAGNSAQ